MGEGTWQRRVLVVEDHALMRSLVADAFGQRGFAVESAAAAHDALQLADRIDPDLLVTDIDLGSRPNGVELATILRERAPHIAVLFLSNLSRDAAAAHARETVAGASYVNKGAISSVDELVDAAEAVLADRPVTRDDARTGPRAALLRLSPAQLETTRLLAAGLTNAEIARRRGVSVRAVEKSVERVFQALGLSGGEQATTPRVALATLYVATLGDPVSGL
ncbi:response regulator transcription factor [Leifsonia sp. F6_8S_P_1B]|uniref:Response regulator transcription factor n=1 Tax=Leifsonia williamsii TaxID=3035919 RepID=A0ABT8KB50_9MICO|nr:response regulator transcription factor [Leifsonia williamsii]MDN4613574.1 response regulator transcription factor [Leifsonia williamsii]